VRLENGGSFEADPGVGVGTARGMDEPALGTAAVAAEVRLEGGGFEAGTGMGVSATRGPGETVTGTGEPEAGVEERL